MSDADGAIGIEELAARLDDVPILDVRTPGEYDGTRGKPCDPRQGHIPSARNLDVYRLLELTADQVDRVLELPPGTELVVYCHSGSRSALAARALGSLGYRARNYVGSWHEWSRRDDLPVEP